MRRVHGTSAIEICAFFVLLVLKFQALLFYEKTHAFSPSLPAPVIYTPLYTRKFLDSSRLKLVTEGTNPGTRNYTTESLPIRYDPSRIRFRCRIAYDGTSFGGFQLQGGRGGSKAKKVETTSDGTSSDDSSLMTKYEKKHKRNNDKSNNNPPRTIQGELENMLSQRFQRLVRVTGAGRTDRGVHARGQAIHFDLYQNETNAKVNSSSSAEDSSFERDLETTMNRMLPSDIRAWNLGRTSPIRIANTGSISTPAGWYNWNAIRTCTSKLYSYRICTGNVMDPLERHHRWQLPYSPGVDPSRLETILKNFEGKHDFVCFAAALEAQEKKTGYAMGTVRTIHKIRLVKEANTNNKKFHADDDKDDMGGDTSQHYYRIDIYLDGALYKMVRNIVGTAIDVSRGWLDEEIFLDLLNRPSELKYTRKTNLCKPAPSNGLTLERAFYPDEIDF